MEEERIPWARPKGTSKKLKLGDAVEKLLKPVVEVLDNTLGTNLKECGKCKKRKEFLNNLTEDSPENS